MALWTWFAQFLTPAVGRGIPPLGEPVPTGTLFASILLPLAVAIGGWGFAYFLHMTNRPSFLAQSRWIKSCYVHFLNKLYFDEIYEAYVVGPTLRLARWLWRMVDLRIDRGVVEFGGQTVNLARWLWRVVDLRIDRGVVGFGGRTVGLARWLREFFDKRVIDQNVERLAYTVDATGHALQKFEPRMLQHHLSIVVFWLVAAMGLFYWLV